MSSIINDSPQKSKVLGILPQDVDRETYRGDVAKVVDHLRAAGYPPLPISPAFSSDEYPLKDKNGDPVPDAKNGGYKSAFSGKNPSFLVRDGKPCFVAHSKFKDRLPSDSEVSEWWGAGQPTGIGTLGGWNGVVWVDIDSKNFDNQASAEAAYDRILELNPALKASWLEQTHSGGYRIAVKLDTPPLFTNFALSPEGKHVGEVLGAGRFTVLAPTIGPSGNPYVNINRAEPVLIESLESIGIYPTKKTKPVKPAANLPIVPASGSELPLIDLITDACRAILGGASEGGDRSSSLAKLIQEVSGWTNWCSANGVRFSGSVEQLASHAGEALGLDAERVARILSSIQLGDCEASAAFMGGDEACWKRVKRLRSNEPNPRKVPDVPKVPKTPKLPYEKPPLVNYNSKGKVFPKPQSCVSEIVAEENRDRLLFCQISQQFYAYDPTIGVWVPEPDLAVSIRVSSELRNRGSEGYSEGYLNAIVRLMRGDLYHKGLTPKKGLLPMKNGTLDLETMTLLPHQSGYHQVSALPYNFDPTATCPLTQAWLLDAQDNDPKRVERLRAILRAIVTGRFDLQLFFEFIGTGGTGKSTFANLAIALVGTDNTVTTSLQILQKSAFETANLKDKRLIVIADSERYGGDVGILKSLTGGDHIRNETKGVKAGEMFACTGMVIICANEPFTCTDATNGIGRRRRTTPFDKKPAAKDRRNLLSISGKEAIGELASELPGIFTWIMAMSEKEMELELREDQSNPSEAKKELMLETNPIAAWLDACCVSTPDLYTFVGNGHEMRESLNVDNRDVTRICYEKQDTHLYANYRKYCAINNNSPVKTQRFSRLVLDVLRDQLSIPVSKGRSGEGVYIKGISLRGENCTAPYLISANTEPMPVEAAVEVAVEMAVEVAVEAAVEVAIEAAVEVAVEIAVEAAVEAQVEAAAEVAIDPLLEVESLADIRAAWAASEADREWARKYFPEEVLRQAGCFEDSRFSEPA